MRENSLRANHSNGKSSNCYLIVIKGTLVKPESLDFIGFLDFRISFPLSALSVFPRF